MAGPTPRPRISIDLTEFKLHLGLTPTRDLTLHFNSPSRRFYLAVVALVVIEMKRQGKLTSIPLKAHHTVLALLNDTIGGSTGSSSLIIGPASGAVEHAPNVRRELPR